MAIDTATKRSNVIRYGRANVSALPVPDGSISVNDRAYLASVYYFTAEVPPDIVITFSLDVIYNMSTGMSKVMVKRISN
jgi:hypothetical protein